LYCGCPRSVAKELLTCDPIAAGRVAAFGLVNVSAEQ